MITIDEAITEQKLYLQHSDQWTHDRLDRAMKLGIEALKEVKNSRSEDYIGDTGLLPGETQD